MAAANEWTPRMVWDRLLEAAALAILLDRDHRTAVIPPSDEIKHSEQTIAWLSWLEADDAELLWARAKRSRWKAICWRLGISRPTAYRRWQRSLASIATRLNGETFSGTRERADAGY